MTTPAITFISPANGPARGDMLIEIWGSGFGASVSVTFGGVASTSVDVIATSLLFVLLPVHDAGAVDVVVQNLDSNGNAIGGEAATATGAFTYQIPATTSEFSSDLVRMIRVLLRAMKQQTLAQEVLRPVNTDYDDTTGDAQSIVKISKLPSLVVLGPHLQENRFYSDNENPTLEVDLDGDGDAETFIEARTAYCADLIFTIIGVSDRDTEALNLMSNFMSFVRRNIYLPIDRLEGHPELGSVKFEFDFASDGFPEMAAPAIPNNSPVVQWSARVIIRGFLFEEVSGIDTGMFPGTTWPRHAIISRGGTAQMINLAHATAIEE